jgi:hypothetical protein
MAVPRTRTRIELLLGVLATVTVAEPLAGQAIDMLGRERHARLLTDGPFEKRGPASGQRESCPGVSHRQFDFWLGDWEIRQELLRPDGSWIALPARNTVRWVAGACALIEEWWGEVLFFWDGMDAATPLEGLSVRAFDPEAGLWRIWWMDSRRPDFGRPFEGRFDKDEGVFLRQDVTADGVPHLTRIRFHSISVDSVRWELANSRNAGSSWSPLWRMQFLRG